MSVELVCKTHNQRIISGQKQPSGEIRMLCQICLSEQLIVPIEQLFQDAQKVAEKKIDKLSKAQKEEIKQLGKMKKTYTNLKQKLIDKIDQIIKIIEQGENSLKNSCQNQIEELNGTMFNPNSFIFNLQREEQNLEKQELFKTLKLDIQSQIKLYNEQLCQIIAQETQAGMMSQTIYQPAQQQPQQPPQPEAPKKIRFISQTSPNQQQPPQIQSFIPESTQIITSQYFQQQPPQQFPNPQLQSFKPPQIQPQVQSEQPPQSTQPPQPPYPTQPPQSTLPPQPTVPDFLISEVGQPQNVLILQPELVEPGLRRMQSEPVPPTEINKTVRLTSSKIRIINNTMLTEKIIKYEIDQQVLIDQCETLVIGFDDKYLINGNSTDIQVWNLNNGTLSQPIQFNANKTQVTCLCFSKKSNWFISGFYDGTAKIWQQNGDWKSIQTFNAHKKYVKQLILNSEEDQFISCCDKSIKVWMRNNVSTQWQCFQTLTETGVQIIFLSLSPNNQYLSSTDYNGKFIIWQKDLSGIFKEKQVMQNPINDKYIRICFIEDNELIATTENESKLVQFYLQNEEFKVGAELQLCPTIKEYNFCVFPIKYNRHLKIAVIRHNNTVYFVSKQSNGQFAISSSIQGNFWLNEISSNGQQLFMWCKDNKSIQMWKLI